MRLCLHPCSFLPRRSGAGGCSVGPRLCESGPAALLHRLHLCIRRPCSNPLDTDTVKGGPLCPSPPPLHFPAPLPFSLSLPHSPPCILRGVSARSDALSVQRYEDLHGPPSQGLRYPDTQPYGQAALAKAGARVPAAGIPHSFLTRKRKRHDGDGDGAGTAPAVLDFPFVFLRIDARRSPEQPDGPKR